MNGRVLILEDSEESTDVLYQVLRDNLESEGYYVEKVGDKETAEYRLKDGDFHLFVQDLYTPGIPESMNVHDPSAYMHSGIQFYWKVRRQFERLPVLMYTSGPVKEVYNFNVDLKGHALIYEKIHLNDQLLPVALELMDAMGYLRNSRRK